MNPASLLSVPDLNTETATLADWLELIAFLDADGTAYLEELVAQQDLEWDSEAVDFGDTDQLLEDIQVRTANELQRRADVLGDSYPFQLEEHVNTIRLIQNWNDGQVAYLFCLILSHAFESQLVSKQAAPSLELMREARDLFQVISTMAAAGYTEGPAYALGWPRPDQTSFINKVKEIWRHFSDGQVRDEPLDWSPAMVKDEGIDVISWWPEPDNRVGRGFVVGQVASGNDWVKKSVKPMVDIFIKEWFIVAPASAPHPTIFVPFLVGNEGHFRRVSISHGYVIDRLRLPPLAARAAELLRGGVVPIERTGELPAITAWINTHKSSLAEHRD